MTNVQLMLAMGVPTLMVLIGILLNRSDVSALRAEMVQLRNDIHRDMTTLRDSIHRDMVGLHERVAVVESKQG